MPGRKTANFPGFCMDRDPRAGRKCPDAGGSCPATRAKPTAGHPVSSIGQVLSYGILPRDVKRSEEIVCGAVLAESVIIEDQGSRERIRVRQCHSLPENSGSRSVSRSAWWRPCSWRAGGALGDGRLGRRPRAAPVGSKEPAEYRRHQPGRPWNPDHRPRGRVSGLPRGGVSIQARPRAVDPGRRGAGRSRRHRGRLLRPEVQELSGHRCAHGKNHKDRDRNGRQPVPGTDAGME